MAMIIETEFNYVSSNGSDVNQKFLMVTSDYSATANKGKIDMRNAKIHSQSQECHRINFCQHFVSGIPGGRTV